MEEWERDDNEVVKIKTSTVLCQIPWSLWLIGINNAWAKGTLYLLQKCFLSSWHVVWEWWSLVSLYQFDLLHLIDRWWRLISNIEWVFLLWGLLIFFQSAGSTKLGKRLHSIIGPLSVFVFKVVNKCVLAVLDFKDIFLIASQVCWRCSKESLSADCSKELALLWVLLEDLEKLLFLDCHEDAHRHRFDTTTSLISQEKTNFSKVASLTLEGNHSLVVSSQYLNNPLLDEEQLVGYLIHFNYKVFSKANLRTELSTHHQNKWRICQLQEFYPLDELAIKEKTQLASQS